MNLLLRMRLWKGKWSLYYNLGDFAEATLANDELTEALVNSLAGCEATSEETITSEQLLGAKDLVVSLYFSCLYLITAETGGQKEAVHLQLYTTITWRRRTSGAT